LLSPDFQIGVNRETPARGRRKAALSFYSITCRKGSSIRKIYSRSCGGRDRGKSLEKILKSSYNRVAKNKEEYFAAVTGKQNGNYACLPPYLNHVRTGNTVHDGTGPV
jgi:hypothetical protein